MAPDRTDATTAPVIGREATWGSQEIGQDQVLARCVGSSVTKCLATYDKMPCSEANSETLNSDMETLNTNCKAVFTGCDTVDVTACMSPATLRSR